MAKMIGVLFRLNFPSESDTPCNPSHNDPRHPPNYNEALNVTLEGVNQSEDTWYTCSLWSSKGPIVKDATTDLTLWRHLMNFVNKHHGGFHPLDLYLYFGRFTTLCHAAQMGTPVFKSRCLFMQVSWAHIERNVKRFRFTYSEIPQDFKQRWTDYVNLSFK